MHIKTIGRAGRRKPISRTWARPLAVAAVALFTGAAYAQVAQYSFTYDKLLQTASILQADEDAAFEPITGGTVLADGTQAAVAAGTTFGVGYSEYETVGGFFGSTTRPKNFQGNASFVGNAGMGDGGLSQAEYQSTGTPSLKTGSGYPIGFDFTYNGEVFDRIGISGQGWIGFGKSADGPTAVAVYTSPSNNASYLPLSNTTLLANDSRRNRVVAAGVSGGSFNVGTNTMPIVYDNNYPAYPGAELRYETIGAAPNRVFVVQWLNYGFTISSTDQQYYRRMDFQIRLYEGTNEVEVRYGKAWRSNTTSYLQTGLGGKTAAAFKTFGFYDAGNWYGWPYSWTAQADHNGYPGSTEFSQRIPWTGTQGIAPYNNYGTGSAQDFYAATFHEMSPLESSPFNVANRTISGTKANTPDMMSFTWTPPSCLVAVSNVSVSNAGLSSATLSWTNTGDVDYAVGTGNDPNTATFTGTASGSSVNLIGLAGTTTYHTWVRTNCGGGQTSVWVAGPTFNTLPCPVPGSLPYGTFAINRVELANINNTSSNTTSTYEDFTSIIGQVESPLSYPITVEGSNPYGDMYAIAYFDWDQDGVFEDAQPIGGHVTTDPAVFTGNITISASALAGNCRMRIVTSYYEQPASACAGPTYGGQTEDYMLNVTPATCVPPSASSMVVSNIGAHTVDLAWGASIGGNIVGYAWEVRSSGNPGDPSPAASGTTAPGTTVAIASGLTANTAYTFHVRSDCGATDGQSVWMSKTFTTELGCGSTWVSPGGVASLTDQQFIETHTICPDNAGDVVTLDFTAWNGLNWNVPNRSGMFIYDGDDTNAPQVMGPGAAYSESGWSIPAGGWSSNNTTNKPPLYTSTAVSGCLTVKVYSYGIWTGGMGWSTDFTCAPRPTCFAPEDLSVTNTTVHGASFSWTAGASPNVEYKVVAGGSPASANAVATGTSASGSATTADVLTANTQYSVYFRGLCDDQGVGDDPSAWSSPALNFRTLVGCGGPYDLYPSTAYAAYTPIPTGGIDSVMVICPDNAGDVVTLTLSQFSFGGNGQGVVGVLVHNGNSTSDPLFSSGLPAKTYNSNPPKVLPAGAYYGLTSGGYSNANLPGPFTSTAANGCLTVNFQAYSAYTYDQGMKAMVSCAPAPACSTPDEVAISNIGGTTATVSWANTSQPSIIEYGPVGFTPGTGAAAGTNGTVANSNATSPYSLTGMNAETSYDIYVRQVCDGPSYSANSWRERFATSADCSTAPMIGCATNVTATFTGAAGSPAYNSAQFTNASTCFGGYSSVTGETFIYKFTAPVTGDYQLNFQRTSGSGDEYFLTTPVANGCGAAAFTCIGGSYYIQEYTYPTSHTSGSNTFHLDAGDHYILMKGTAAPKTVDFEILCPGIPPCVTAPTFPANNTTLAVNANPIVFTWPASFGAESYDVYFQGALVANTPTNSINGGSSYTTANIASLYGLGNDVTWRVVPKNATYGAATCPTDWTFSVGGNGASNALPLTSGQVYGGNTYTANGYSNLESSFWGNDAWYSFSATECGDSASVSLCLPASASNTSMALVIRRASDNAVLFPPAGEASYTDNVNPGECFQYQWFNYDPNVWNWVYETPKIEVAPGETYYVIVDGYSYGLDFTMSYTEISNSPDSDGDGIPDCADDCPFTPGVEGGPCTAPGFSVGKIINCECVGGNMAVVSITTDGNPTELSWEITNETMAVVASGAPTAGQANTVVSESVFLPGSCYSFQLMDSNGDGITSGGWELRTTGGKLLLRDDFASGSVSPATPAANPNYGSGHSFCLPEGPANIAPTECGIFNNLLGNKVYANKVTGAANYQFEFSDPDAGFMRRIARPYNYVHFWDMVTNPLVPGVKYFARVRTDRDGPMASAHFGSGCEMGLATAVVTCSELIQAPAYGHSCNETRSFNTNNSFIYAKPVQGATEYQFRIFNTSEGYDQIFTRSTYILQMKWNPNVAPLLQDGYTYNVEINVKVNGVYSGFCASSCTISIDNSGNRPEASITQAVGQEADQQMGVITMWPNPVRDGQVNLNIDGIVDADQQISVTIVDLYGKQVFAQEFGNNGDRFNTILNLNSDIASGVYLVSINVNGTNTVQRLSIIR
ncbi:MAG: T9SS type A sorting domain-containing protein [Flavobacteriales bacterium]|nr:T9SS type A sorting domain-containing protein [Flavobacteriales bacterium]